MKWAGKIQFAKQRDYAESAGEWASKKEIKNGPQRGRF
jgi:hypothetical protein